MSKVRIQDKHVSEVRCRVSAHSSAPRVYWSTHNTNSSGSRNNCVNIVYHQRKRQTPSHQLTHSICLLINGELMTWGPSCVVWQYTMLTDWNTKLIMCPQHIPPIGEYTLQCLQDTYQSMSQWAWTMQNIGQINLIKCNKSSKEIIWQSIACHLISQSDQICLRY